MTFSPSDMADVKRMAAEIIAAKAIEEAGSAMDFVIFPVGAVVQMTGLSRQTVPQRMPITETSPGKHGVTMKNLKTYIDDRTVGPTPKAKARG